VASPISKKVLEGEGERTISLRKRTRAKPKKRNVTRLASIWNRNKLPFKLSDLGGGKKVGREEVPTFYFVGHRVYCRKC